MRADRTKERIFSQEIFRIRLKANEERKEKLGKIIQWVDDYPMKDGSVSQALVFVLPTKGCKYSLAKHGGCSMCPLPLDNPWDPSDELIHSLPDKLWQIFQERGGTTKFKAVKFYTSGSFIDRWELPFVIREEILGKFSDHVEEIVIETRCEFVTKKNIENLLKIIPKEKLIVAIGQETTDDEINKRSINKGHTLNQFKRAVNLLHDYGIQVKGYLLLKPLFMSEISSVEDVLRSAQEMKKLNIKNISINPSYIGKGTLMNELFREGSYRPPWLWSVFYATLNIKKIVGEGVRVICDPVAAGKERGPRNCGRCDMRFKEALKLFSATQDLSTLENLYCECKQIYKSIITSEHLSYGMALKLKIKRNKKQF